MKLRGLSGAGCGSVKLSLLDLQHLAHCLANPSQKIGGEPSERRDEASVVDGAQLVDEEVRLVPKPARHRDADAQGLGIVYVELQPGSAEGPLRPTQARTQVLVGSPPDVAPLADRQIWGSAPVGCSGGR